MRAVVVVMATGFLCVAALSAQAPAPAPAPRAAVAAPAGNVQKGKELFTAYYCYSCHGTDGQGGAGVKIAPNPVSYTAFVNYIRKPAGGMPPYVGKLVPEPDLADIYAFLRSIPPGQPSRNIPLLNQ